MGKYVKTVEVHGYADLYTGEIYEHLPLSEEMLAEQYEDAQCTMKHIVPLQALESNTKDEESSSVGRRGRFRITVEFIPDTDLPATTTGMPTV